MSKGRLGSAVVGRADRSAGRSSSIGVSCDVVPVPWRVVGYLRHDGILVQVLRALCAARQSGRNAHEEGIQHISGPNSAKTSHAGCTFVIQNIGHTFRDRLCRRASVKCLTRPSRSMPTELPYEGKEERVRQGPIAASAHLGIVRTCWRSSVASIVFTS